MCVGDVSRELVELRAADGTDGRAGVGVGMQSVFRVATRGLQSREPGRKCNVEERLWWQGEEFVVGLNE